MSAVAPPGKSLCFPFLSSIFSPNNTRMIIPAASTDDRYSGGDPYTDDDQYGDAGPASVSYGSDYGTGTYSDYDSESGRYTVTIEIAGYGTGESGTGYGYLAGGTDDQYSAGTSIGGTYGYAPEDTMHSYRDVTLDYVIDVLDGDVEI